jgi:taurine dioxygenase
MSALTIRRLGYALGAQITGLDLKSRLDDESVEALRKAWLDHVVLCFPGQDLSAEEQIAFAGRFGELDDNHLTTHTSPIAVLVSKPVTLGERKYPGSIANIWHSDLAFTNRPSTGTFLNSKELPDIGGDTLFASMYLAYEGLSPAFQRLIEQVEAVHDVTLNAAFKGYSPQVQEERRRACPLVAHPIVRIHPETGRKALYVGERIRNFVGMTEEETKPLLAFLNEHATRYEFQYRHQWSHGDLLMWDNRCAMHRAVEDFDRTQQRRLQRCTLLGPRTGRLLGEADSGSASTPMLASAATAS